MDNISGKSTGGVFGTLARLVAALSLAATIGVAGYIVLNYRDRVDETERRVATLEGALRPYIQSGQFTLAAVQGPRGEPGEPGPVGPAGDAGPAGPAGIDGAHGQNIELRASTSHIQWRRVGDDAWIDLVSLETLRGPPGATGAAAALLTNDSSQSPSAALPATALGTGVYVLEKGRAVLVGPDSLPVVLLGETQNGMRFLVDGADKRPSPGNVVVVGGGPCSMTFMGKADSKGNEAQVRFAQCD